MQRKHINPGHLMEFSMKPGKLTQLYIQFVIAVKYRRRFLRAEIRP